jgi:hypothetical protein
MSVGVWAPSTVKYLSIKQHVRRLYSNPLTRKHIQRPVEPVTESQKVSKFAQTTMASRPLLFSRLNSFPIGTAFTVV